MTPYERQQFYELVRKFKEEKRKQEELWFRRHVEFLCVLVGLVIFMLLVLSMI